MSSRKRTIALLVMIALAIPCPAFPCSSLAFVNGSALVFGTNYDNSWAPGHLFINARHVRKSGWEPGTTGRVASWTARYGSVTISPVGSQLPSTGMNEVGLMFSSMMLPDTRVPPPDERPPLAGPLWWQYVLDTCATLEDLKKAVADVRITDTENHYLVCDRSGSCAVVECRLGKVVIHDGRALPVKALTNARYVECVRRFRTQAPVPAARYHSFNRFSRLAANMSRLTPASAPAAVEEAFRLLADVGAGNNTRWSVVLDAGERRVYLKTHRNHRTRYIDLEKIDFACARPVSVLDAHADLGGDITSAFREYRHDEMARHVPRAVAHFRPGRSQDWALDKLAHLERFACEPAGK